MATVPEQAEEREYPESWMWDEDGDRVSGRFVRFDRAPTRDYGMKAILVLDVDGVPRSVWLTATVLFNKVRDEVASRPKRNLEPGEQVSIKRLEKTKGEGGRQGYWKFQVLFPDRPQATTEEIFDLDQGTDIPEPKELAESSQPAAGSQDEDIPF
jgi:hypothetical protein